MSPVCQNRVTSCIGKRYQKTNDMFPLMTRPHSSKTYNNKD